MVIPHAAAAIAVGFFNCAFWYVFTPYFTVAKWLGVGARRHVSTPWLSGWELAPGGMFPHDPYGISIILGLTLKELPFLLLMALGALAQPELGKKLRQQYKVALNLGYYPITAFFKAVLPVLYPFFTFAYLSRAGLCQCQRRDAIDIRSKYAAHAGSHYHAMV
ncbi:hypothetical protein [Psychrobacter sp. ENNN9_III]|uniref:hypothetical protein n=1 Tax=Psychrobacter sp. ENNN9_III TaxID=1254334 RepID=UPI0022282211|nr:hypothetical protein [Psychrobacter sp. ENNN9_III]